MSNGWLVKDLAELCGVSVRLLHHWDHVDLMSPSDRLPNGYRLYSEQESSVYNKLYYIEKLE